MFYFYHHMNINVYMILHFELYFLLYIFLGIYLFQVVLISYLSLLYNHSCLIIDDCHNIYSYNHLSNLLSMKTILIYNDIFQNVYEFLFLSVCDFHLLL